MMHQPASSEPLDYLEAREVLWYGWILSTSEVSQLLGLSAKDLPGTVRALMTLVLWSELEKSEHKSLGRSKKEDSSNLTALVQ